jgi:hypothetical protein
MSSIADAGVVTVSDTASLFAFFRWASWASTRWDCLIDLEGFEDSLLEAGLFIQLHFVPIMGWLHYLVETCYGSRFMISFVVIRGCFRWWGSSYRSTLNSSKARLPPIPDAIPSRTRAGVAGRGFAQKSGSLLWVTGKSRLPEFLCIRLASSRTWQTPAPVPYRPSALIPRLERWRPFQVLRLQREATLFQWRWTLRANLPTWQTSPATTFRRTASLPTERRRPSG